jgi:hypothetical protein
MPSPMSVGMTWMSNSSISPASLLKQLDRQKF